MSNTAYPEGQRIALIAHYEPWIREMISAMGLDRWNIVITDHPPIGDGIAEVSQYHWAEDATIYLGDDFFTRYGRADQRETIAHELLHLLQKPWKVFVWGLVEWLGEGGIFSEVYKRQAQDAEELTTDPIARAWARSLPLPPDPHPERFPPPRNPDETGQTHRN
jgi:hypothetical protein